MARGEGCGWGAVRCAQLPAAAVGAARCPADTASGCGGCRWWAVSWWLPRGGWRPPGRSCGGRRGPVRGRSRLPGDALPGCPAVPHAQPLARLSDELSVLPRAGGNQVEGLMKSGCCQAQPSHVCHVFHLVSTRCSLIPGKWTSHIVGVNFHGIIHGLILDYLILDELGEQSARRQSTTTPAAPTTASAWVVR
jgi:hypothetical protein